MSNTERWITAGLAYDLERVCGARYGNTLRFDILLLSSGMVPGNEQPKDNYSSQQNILELTCHVVIKNINEEVLPDTTKYMLFIDKSSEH